MRQYHDLRILGRAFGEGTKNAIFCLFWWKNQKPVSAFCVRSGYFTSLCAAALLSVLFWGCQPEEEMLTADPNIRLSFSADTVFFDTVFTSVGSISKRLKVYNPSENAIMIDRIALGDQVGSAYSLIINGIEDKEVRDIRLLGRDSLLILARVTIDPTNGQLPFLVQDSIVFERGGQLQDVKLVSWGQDAIFFRGGLQTIDCNASWAGQKPYVVFDSLLVSEGCTLTIEPGTRVHFGPGAALFVGGSLQVLGTSERPVQLTSVRTDAAYAEVPGQWDAVYFLPTSQENIIQWAELSNANIGCYVGKPDPDGIPELTISHSKIQNMAVFGVQSVSADVVMVNSLVSRCAVGTLRASAGGNYWLYHNTFAGVSADFFREEPALVMLNNLDLGNGNVLAEPLNVEMLNNIVWGRLREEVFIGGGAEAPIQLAISGNLFKTGLEDLPADNLLNQDPLFRDPSSGDFRLDSLGESPAIDFATPIAGITTDLQDSLRDEQPDAGAYEFVQK